MNLTDRLITAIVEKCDGLAITAEQASNILAYLQYGAPMNNASPQADAAPSADDAWESYLAEQKLIIGMPGLHARSSFIAGYRAAIAAEANGEQ